MYETYFFGLSGMTRDQLYTERDCFYFTLNAILSHPANRECNGQCKLLYWHDDPTMSTCLLLIFTDDHSHTVQQSYCTRLCLSVSLFSAGNSVKD